MKTSHSFLFYLIISFFLLTNPHPLTGQTPTDSLGFRYFEKASLFDKAQKYDSAIFYHKLAAKWFANNNLKQLNLKSLTEIAYLYSYRNDIDSAENILANVIDKANALGSDSTTVLMNAYTLKARILCNYSEFERAIHYMSRVLSLSTVYQDPDDMRTSSAHNNLGIVYSLAGQYDKTIYHCSQASAIVRKIYGNEHPQLASVYNTIGNAYLDLGDLDSAQVMHERALQIRLKSLGKNHLHTAASYSNLSVIFYEKGDYQKALDYEKMVYGIRKEVYGEQHPLTAQCLNNFGIIYEATDHYLQALKYHLQALAIREALLPANHPDIAMSYMNLANIYSHSNEFDKALNHHHKALEIKTAIFGDQHIEVAQIINNIGDIYFRKGDYIMAFNKFTEALRNLKASPGGETHPDLANYYNNLAECHLALNQPDSALQCIESAFRINSRTLTAAGNHMETLVFDQPEYLRSVALKAGIHTFIYHNNTINRDALDLAIREYKNAVDYMHILRSEYSGDESKQWLAEESAEILAFAINTLYEKFRITNDSSLLDQLYSLMETGKYGILRESITHKKAMHIAGIPDSLVIKEKELAVAIRSRKAEILNIDAVMDTMYGQEISRLYKNLIIVEEQYENLKTDFQTTYPAYEELTKESPVVTAVNLSRALDKQTALLAYTIADTMLYLQVFETSGTHLFHAVIDSVFDESLISFLRSIKTYDFSNFWSKGNYLYDVLIRPAEHLISSKEHLVIIPDKRLLFLPFETLCSKWVPTGQPDFTQAPYLIKKHDISYHYSLNLFINQAKSTTESPKNQEGFIGFAPVFKSDSVNGYILAQNKVIFDTLSNSQEILRSVSVNGNTWNELAFSENEIHDIVSLFDREAITARGYFHSKANERVFRQEAGHYRYIHIATHGLINETFPDLSGLILSQSCPKNQSQNTPPEDDGILFSSELYDLDLNASLVVLSACETGTGKLVKGEGVISMTRAFLYAGIPNIIFSLWKVGDVSTHKLMVSFYKKMLSGQSYSKALQQAKLNLIQDEKYAYPLFWGGFTLVATNENTLVP